MPLLNSKSHQVCNSLARALHPRVHERPAKMQGQTTKNHDSNVMLPTAASSSVGNHRVTVVTIGWDADPDGVHFLLSVSRITMKR